MFNASEHAELKRLYDLLMGSKNEDGTVSVVLPYRRELSRFIWSLQRAMARKVTNSDGFTENCNYLNFLNLAVGFEELGKIFRGLTKPTRENSYKCDFKVLRKVIQASSSGKYDGHPLVEDLKYS